MTKAKLKKGGFVESFLEKWRALVTLVKMQLKEKMDLGYLRSRRKLIFKTTWLFIEFAAITAVIAVIFYFLKLFSLFSLTHDIPVSVISLAFGVMLLLSLITDTIGLMKSLYFSKDNTVLLTFPATPSLVFFSKLVTYYVYEFRKSFMFTIPMFIAYGLIVRGYGLHDPKGLLYYPWPFVPQPLRSPEGRSPHRSHRSPHRRSRSTRPNRTAAAAIPPPQQGAIAVKRSG